MLKVCVNDYRMAAHRLTAGSNEVTVAGMSRELSKPVHEVRRVLLQMPWLATELGVEFSDRSKSYSEAAKAISERGDMVTIKALAYELGFATQSVTRRLVLQPELVSELGVVYMRKRRSSYVHRANRGSDHGTANRS